MPTKKPRINVTFDPEVYQALKEFQQATNVSASSFIASTIRASLQAIRGLTEAARLAQEKNLDAFDLIQRQMLEAINQASQISLDIENARQLHRSTGFKSDDNG